VSPSQDADDLNLETHRLTGQRVVEVKQHGLVVDLLHGTSERALARGCRELHHITNGIVLVGIAKFAQGFLGHPLHHVRVAWPKGFARCQLEGLMRPLAQAQQPLLHGGRQLTRAHGQGRGFVGKGVDDVALRSRKSIVQGEKRIGADGRVGHMKASQKLRPIVESPPQVVRALSPMPPSVGASCMADLPTPMRPREKLLRQGAGALSDVELLALFLRTGVAGKNVFVLAHELLQRFGGFAGLVHASVEQLKTVHGLGGDAKRAQLAGLLEMARRALTQQLQQGEIMNSPQVVKQFLQLELAHLKHEVFAVLFLDSQNRLLSYQPMFRGSLTQTMVYPREIAKAALALGADGVVLAHNHPSGQVRPSPSDIRLTRSLQDALNLVDVRVRDHVIVSQGAFLSMAEEGLL